MEILSYERKKTKRKIQEIRKKTKRVSVKEISIIEKTTIDN